MQHSILDDPYEAYFKEAAAASTTTNGCDHRLSRAARALLERHLRSILALKEGSNIYDEQSIDSATIWELLEMALVPSAAANNCPLLPSKDMLRWHEEQSTVLLPPPSKGTSRMGVSLRSALAKQPKRIWQKIPWYQCALCGKMFSSRFYLDQHLDQTHTSTTEISAGAGEMGDICPAIAWCPALPFCAHQALEAEPYYGPGSNGLSPDDRFDVHRALWQQAHPELGESPCDENEMQQSQQQCYQMMEHCFSETIEIRQRLEQSICDRISCPDRLHQLFFAASASSNEAAAMMMKDVHEWQDEWSDYYAEHHEIGWMGAVLLVALTCGYLWYFINTARQNQGGANKTLRRRKDPKGTRLLHKNSNTSFLASTKKGLGFSDPKSKQQ
mgnify:CR=1 FL=1